MRAANPVLAIAFLFASCAGEPHNERFAGSHYGGVFNLNETEPLRSIFPLTLTQASAFRIMSQVYQGLVSFDPDDLSIVPCLAEKWDVDASATQYTFHLRPHVRFHDDPAFPDGQGREVTADDVVHCFTSICTAGKGDQIFWLFQDRVEGANAYFEATAHGAAPEQGVKGVERVDDRTVRISLTHPSPNFLQIIAHQGCWIWPAELPQAYGSELLSHAIGTGPFRLQSMRAGEIMVLERNQHYWKKDANGDALPYLDAVRVTFNEDKNTEFEEFLKGRVTALLELPAGRVRMLRDSIDASGQARFKLRSMPALASQFYGFDLRHPPFNDLRVRKAFAMAIDKRYLTDSVLSGMATPSAHGIVAPGMERYPYDQVPGIPWSPDSARQLLSEAGYPGGKGFPPVQLQVNADGFGYVLVAEAVQDMLQRELGVPISVSVLRADQHYARVDMGQVRFWREGWTADHPDPENFLSLLYGKNAVQDTTLPASVNKTRYRDPEFDKHFQASQGMTDPGSRAIELAKAEAQAMHDLPVVPLYHEDATQLSQSWVRGLHLNAIEFLDLGAVWFEHQPAPQR